MKEISIAAKVKAERANLNQPLHYSQKEQWDEWESVAIRHGGKKEKLDVSGMFQTPQMRTMWVYPDGSTGHLMNY